MWFEKHKGDVVTEDESSRDTDIAQAVVSVVCNVNTFKQRMFYGMKYPLIQAPIGEKIYDFGTYTMVPVIVSVSMLRT